MRTSVFNPLIFGLFLCVMLMPGHHVHAQSSLYSLNEDGLPYFFTPAEFAPLQAGTFNVVSRSVSQHPLAAINRNPAAINAFSGNGYFYADVKTLADVDYLVRTNPCPPPELPAICLPYYREDNISRQVQEPFLSTALFFSPFENTPFWAGITYQFLKFSEPYYRTGDIIPYGPGLNAGANTAQLFSEVDYFDKSGHSPALYAGYAFSDALSFGLKVNFNVYNGNGNSVSEHYGRTGTSDLSSHPQTFEHSYWRSGDYRHWDFSAGVNWNLNERITTGLSAGFLTGRFRQSGNEFTVSDFYQEDAHLVDYFYSMDMNSQNRNGFNRDANTYYSTATLNWQLTGRSQLNFTYSGSISQQDFNFGEALFSHRLIESNSLLNDEWYYNYSLTENQQVMEGAGTTNNERHTAGLFFTRDFNYGFSLTTGLQLLVFKENQDYMLDETSNHYYKTIKQTGNAPEESMNNETFHEFSETVTERISLTSGYLPVIVTKSFNRFLTVDLGLQAHRQKLDSKHSIFSNRNEVGSTHFNAYGAVSVNPTHKMSIRFITFTDRRQVAHNGDMDSYRFRVVTEFHF